jgi:hypothetical protein
MAMSSAIVRNGFDGDSGLEGSCGIGFDVVVTAAMDGGNVLDGRRLVGGS